MLIIIFDENILLVYNKKYAIWNKLDIFAYNTVDYTGIYKINKRASYKVFGVR